MANVAKLLIIQGGKCFYCGKKLALEDATIDHVVPKALGGDNTEGNTVACCHFINQAFGNATPKEKLTAVMSADGRLECPIKPVQKMIVPIEPVVTVNEPTTPAIDMAQSKTALPAKPKAAIKATPEKSPTELKKALQASFQASAAAHGGDKALLSEVGMELRKRVPGFVVKQYGEKTLAKLVVVLGYHVDKHWCARVSSALLKKS